MNHWPGTKPDSLLEVKTAFHAAEACVKCDCYGPFRCQLLLHRVDSFGQFLYMPVFASSVLNSIFIT